MFLAANPVSENTLLLEFSENRGKPPSRALEEDFRRHGF